MARFIPAAHAATALLFAQHSVWHSSPPIIALASGKSGSSARHRSATKSRVEFFDTSSGGHGVVPAHSVTSASSGYASPSTRACAGVSSSRMTRTPRARA